MKTDMEIVASLVMSHPDAARRLAERSAEAETSAARLKAVEYELKFLLSHAKQIPVTVTYEPPDGEDAAAEDVVKVTPDPNGGSFVLADCPRLEKLMAGEIPSEGRV